MQIRKYDRTPHLEGSALQAGDDTSGQVTIAELRRRYPDCTWVSEEKLDGANAATFFDEDLELRLQCRGHLLSGGASEAQFNLFKTWARCHEAELLERLEDRYIMYGEWTFARHTMFYDRLPHYFHEFDIWDRREERYLSTDARRSLLDGAPVTSVPVVSRDWPASLKALKGLVGPSLYQGPDWRDNLAASAERAGIDPETALRESRGSDLAEGLYIKIERGDETVDRFKWVRHDFVQTILDNETHWSSRPIIRNELAEGVDILAMPSDVQEMTP